jgi:hypothetical protein
MTDKPGEFSVRILLLAIFLFSAAAQAQSIVAQGPWIKVDYEVAGQWKITRHGEQLFVELGDDFETKNGPDLHILLSSEPLRRLTDANASQDALVVGLLKTSDDSPFFKKMKGTQRLVIPSEARLSDYRTILIHCVRYSHLWAGAELNLK